MWLSNQLHRPIKALALILAASLVLAGCSFTPLYGTDSASSEYNLAYADPSSQIEQIIYQDLSLRLGRTVSSDAPLVKISASSSSKSIGRSSTGLPTNTRELTVTANAKITQTDALNPEIVKTIYSGTKSASATYTTNGQRLADQEAAKDAQNRAAKAVAQSLRLSIAAALNKGQ